MQVISDNISYMLGGLYYTLLIAATAILGSFSFGILLAIGRLSSVRVIRYSAISYIEMIRSVPLILFIFFIYFMISAIGYNVSAITAAITASIIFFSTYFAEIIRGGIQSIDRGQMEAARATGLSYTTAMRSVVLPQAIRRMMPALVSEVTIIVKESSLAMVIGVPEFFHKVLIVNARVLTEPFTLLGFAAAVYFVICYTLSLLSKRLELRMN